MILFAADAAASAAGHLRFDDLGLSPIIVSIGSFSLRWYSLAYIAGIVVGWRYLLRLLKQPGAPMARRHADDLVFYATMGIILGGRIGYILFYGWEMWRHPLDMLRLWDGGMSFHGGVIGTSLGLILLARKHKLNWLRVHDFVACCVPFGLFFGRLANFVNDELWGAANNRLSWTIVPGVSAKLSAEARHPSQLYEAALEGIALFLLLWWAFWRTKARYEPGKLVGLFLLGYGLARFAVEFVREPDGQFQGTVFGAWGFHMGQFLCLPMIAGGLYLVLTAKSRRTRVESIAGSESVA